LYGCSDKPRQTEQRTDKDENGEHEQVQMIAVRFLQFTHHTYRVAPKNSKLSYLVRIFAKY